MLKRLTWYLLNKEVLFTDHYGFIPLKSVKNAFSSVRKILFNGKKKTLVTIVAFMHIKAAFENARWPAVIKQLKDAEGLANILHRT